MKTTNRKWQTACCTYTIYTALKNQHEVITATCAISGIVVSTVALQQEGPGFESTGLSMSLGYLWDDSAYM